MGAEVLMEALRTHPAVIVDGMIHGNPFQVQRRLPDEGPAVQAHVAEVEDDVGQVPAVVARPAGTGCGPA
jgi:hypothetical protein